MATSKQSLYSEHNALMIALDQIEPEAFASEEEYQRVWGEMSDRLDQLEELMLLKFPVQCINFEGLAWMRNEDGTQWYSKHGWTDSKRDASIICRCQFEKLEQRVEKSRMRDCPDNGFFGIYNLTFEPF